MYISGKLFFVCEMSDEKDSEESGAPLDDVSESNDKFEKENSECSKVEAPGNSLLNLTRFTGLSVDFLLC